MIPTPYSGKENYIFISYSHRDTDQVFPVIAELVQNGYRVWFDQGIDPGTEWDENIAEHIERCGYFLAFVSKNYLASNNCKDELNYSRDLEKERLVVYLEEVELPGGMAMRLNRIQSIFKYAYKNDGDFYVKLFTANNIDSCKDATDSGTPAEDEPQNREEPPKYDPPKDDDLPKQTPPKSGESAPKKKKQRPKTTSVSMALLVFSTVLWVVAMSQDSGVVSLIIAIVTAVMSIIAKPGLGGIGYRIWSQVVFWFGIIAVFIAIDDMFYMSNTLPAEIIIAVVACILYYRPKWYRELISRIGKK